MGKNESSVLVDSDVLIALSDTKKQQYTLVYETFQHFLDVGTVVFIAIITEIEMIQGSKNNIEKNRIIKFLKPFQRKELLPEIGTLARTLIINYSASHGLMLGDSLIAATALYFNIPLFTFNKKDFRFIDGLTLYEP